MLKTNYCETVLKKISRLRNIIFGMVGFCIAFIVSGMGLYYGYITDSSGTNMYIMLPGLLILIGLAVFMRSFFKGYIEVIKVMTNADLETLKRLGESRWWLEKYFPSFIIYSGKIRVFKLYRQPDISFNELIEISIRPQLLQQRQAK